MGLWGRLGGFLIWTAADMIWYLFAFVDLCQLHGRNESVNAQDRSWKPIGWETEERIVSASGWVGSVVHQQCIQHQTLRLAARMFDQSLSRFKQEVM